MVTAGKGMDLRRYLAIALLAIGANTCNAASLGELDAAIRARYTAVEDAIRKGDTARLYVELYQPGAVVAGEGTEKVARDEPSLMKIIDEVLKATRDCSIHPDGARAVSGRMAYSFVTYRCVPVGSSERSLVYRGIYVWTQEKGIWRVKAEMFGIGSM